MLRKISLVGVAALLAACAATTEVPATPSEPAPAVQQCPEPPPPLVCPTPELPPPPQCPEPVRCPPPPACPQPKPAACNNGKLTLGAVEFFEVQPGNLRLEARVDTGATTTSLHATNVVVFERDGERWVRFDAGSGEGRQAVTLELPWVRRVRIKGEGEEADTRPVVLIELSGGGVSRRVEVTLNDRSNYEFPLLLGRNFLRDTAVVDVSRTHLLGK